jgi:hypothetical protein
MSAAELVRVSRGIWLAAALADDSVTRLAALLGALPDGTVLSHATAAELHGMWIPRSDGIAVTVPARGPANLAPSVQRQRVACHRRQLADDETAVVHGLRVTSIARTWYDLAACLRLADLVAAGDAALRGGAVTPAELARGLAARRGQRGVRLARVALPLLDGRSRSRPESHMRVALRSRGLPAPAVNEAVYDEHDGWLAEPDLSYRRARLAIEYQGADHADPRRMRKDVSRHMDLRRAGWEVLYYTADQIFRRPDVLVRDVVAALRQRAPDLLASAPPRPSTEFGTRVGTSRTE